jgi:hypothetical protein
LFAKCSEIAIFACYCSKTPRNTHFLRIFSVFWQKRQKTPWNLKNFNKK